MAGEVFDFYFAVSFDFNIYFYVSLVLSVLFSCLCFEYAYYYFAILIN